MEKGKIDFWDLVLLIAALLILFWATLKAFGIINSPAWFDMLPFFSIGIAIIGATYKLGKIKRGIEETEKKVSLILFLSERFKKIEHEHNLYMEGKLKPKH